MECYTKPSRKIQKLFGKGIWGVESEIDYMYYFESLLLFMTIQSYFCIRFLS